MIDSELRYGITLVEETQLLYGTNAGSDLDGMVPNAKAYDATVIPEAVTKTRIDTIGVGILQCTLSDFMPNGIVMHPSDWWAMRLFKDSDGHCLLGNPQETVPTNLFGVPVVLTRTIAAGTFLLRDFQSTGTLYDRWAQRVEVGFENDDFTRNLVTIRAENRLAIGGQARHGFDSW